MWDDFTILPIVVLMTLIAATRILRTIGLGGIKIFRNDDELTKIILIFSVRVYTAIFSRIY